MNKNSKIVVCVIFCLGIAFGSRLVTKTSLSTWYPTLIKPSFNPPNWAFPLAWTVLFVLMGVAAGLVWNLIDKKNDEVKKALLFFGIQLILNALWSMLFFGLQNPFLALIEIVVLWLMIYETFVKFSKIDRLAGNLLVPYLLWVAFAAVLNGSIWWLNSYRL